MRQLWNEPGDTGKRIDGWLNVPNSYVNDNGRPNFSNSNAENDNVARVSVGMEGSLHNAFSPAANLSPCFCQFSLQFKYIGIINEF
jgi:hypothetical protein